MNPLQRAMIDEMVTEMGPVLCRLVRLAHDYGKAVHEGNSAAASVAQVHLMPLAAQVHQMLSAWEDLGVHLDDFVREEECPENYRLIQAGRRFFGMPGGPSDELLQARDALWEAAKQVWKE